MTINQAKTKEVKMKNRKKETKCLCAWHGDFREMNNNVFKCLHCGQIFRIKELKNKGGVR